MKIKKAFSFILSILLLSLFFSGCTNKQQIKLSDLLPSKNGSYNEVYLSENAGYEPYIVLSEYGNGILLLRKEVLPEQKRFDEYKALYEKSEIDNYLENDFIKRFSDETRAHILPTTITVTSNDSLYQAGKETHEIIRKVFLLSYTELGFEEHQLAAEEGNSVSLFNDSQSRIAYSNGNVSGYWLRTPYTNYDSVAWSVNENGYKADLSVSYENGVRPAVCFEKDSAIIHTDHGFVFDF